MRALRVEPIRVDRVDPAVSNRRNRFKAPPRLERFAPEASGDDHLGPRVEDLLAGDERGERFCSGKNVAPAAQAQRIADEMPAVHGEQGRVPDLHKHRDATLPGVAIAQSRDLIFELPRACFRDLRAAGQLTDQELIQTYKDQHRVERGFSFLKDPLFLASSVFVKKSSRIVALSLVMVLCLLVYRLAEYRLRAHLAATGQTVPNQLKQPTDRPTMRWMFQPSFRTLN